MSTDARVFSHSTRMLQPAPVLSNVIVKFSIGAGSAAHLCGVFFQQKTGARFQYVPYRGAAPVMQDLMANQIDLSCLDGTATLPNVAVGQN